MLSFADDGLKVSEEESIVTALRMVVEELKQRDLKEVARNSGAERTKRVLRLKYLGRDVLVVPPNFEAVYEDNGSPLPPKRRLLILHYLNNARGARPKGGLVDFRQIPSGMFYYPVFVATVERPLLSLFGERPEELKEFLLRLGGREEDKVGDICATVDILPLVPVTFVFYRGDEEFPPSCKVLFDPTVSEFFTAEEVRILAEDVVELLAEVKGKK